MGYKPSGGGSTNSASSTVSCDKMSLATTRTYSGTSSDPSSRSPTPRSTRTRPPHVGANHSTCEDVAANVSASPQMISGLQTTSRSQSPEPDDACCDIPLVETPRDLQLYLAGHSDLQRQHPATPQQERHGIKLQDALPSYILKQAVPSPTVAQAHPVTIRGGGGGGGGGGAPVTIQSFARPSSSPAHHSPLGVYNYQARTSSAATPYGYTRQPAWHAC